MLWTLTLGPVLAGAVLAGTRWRRSTGLVAVGVALATTGLGAAASARDASAGFSWGPQLALSLEVTGLSRVMVVLVPAIAAAVLAWVAASYGGHEPRPARLAGLLLVFVGAMELLVTAADLLTLLVAWELVAACSWVLIGHRYDDAERVQSATAAYLTTRTGDVGLFVAAGAAWAGTGSLAFADLERAGAGWLAAIAAGVIVAALAKSAQLPFSPWLFAAMAGPTPVSALLHSATMVAAGAYLLARLAPSLAGVWWFGDTVAGVGVLTALLAGVVALSTFDVKRALAASTSAQYGLVLVAIGAGSTAAASAHLLNHAVFKALLFLSAGVIVSRAGTLDLRELRLGRAPRPLAAVFVVGAAALAAVPPLGGAWSKEEILAAAAHASPVLAGGVVVAAFLSALYAVRLTLLIFGREPERAVPAGPQAPSLELAPHAVLAFASLLLGALWLPGGGALVERVTGASLSEGAWWELPVSIAAIVAAVLAAGALLSLDRLAAGVMPPRARRFAAEWFWFPRAAAVLVVDPVVALSRGLARFDSAFVDAGVRTTAAAATAASRLLSRAAEPRLDRIVSGIGGAALALAQALGRRAEAIVDRAVEAIAAGSVVLARASRTGDDHGIDRAVESLAEVTTAAARRTRRIQTGLSHHYYLLIAAGTAVLVAVAALGRA